MKFILFFFFLTISCSHKKSNQISEGHEELYSEPQIVQSQALNKFEKKIIIASTNDLKGNFSPLTIPVTDSQKRKVSIRIGGDKALSSYLRILRDTYKDVLLVDSGNIFSEKGNFQEIKKFYERHNYDAFTIGINDLNIRSESIQSLKKFARNSNVPLLLSNLYELRTARTVEWKGSKSHLLKDINGVKIGLIGLVPNDTVDFTPTQNRLGLYIEDMLQSTLRHARLLRSIGADIIIVLTNQGVDCNSKLAEIENVPVSKVNFDPHQKNICNLNNSFGEYLNRLPPKLVDVVFGGRNNSKIANYINGMMVIAGYDNGKSFNYAELVINTETKKINHKKSIIHQPVFLCHEFFEETNDCYYEEKSVNHLYKKPAYFLGKKIIINEME